MENQEILQAINQISGRFDKLENVMGGRFDKLGEEVIGRLDALEKRIGALEKRFDVLEKRFDALEKRFDVLEKRFGALEKKYSALEQAYASLAEDITAIRMALEKEIRPNINQIAEGHASLINEFQAARIHEDNVEILSVRTRYLESRFREMEAKLASLQKAV